MGHSVQTVRAVPSTHLGLTLWEMLLLLLFLLTAFLKKAEPCLWVSLSGLHAFLHLYVLHPRHYLFPLIVLNDYGFHSFPCPKALALCYDVETIVNICCMLSTVRSIYTPALIHLYRDPVR